VLSSASLIAVVYNWRRRGWASDGRPFTRPIIALRVSTSGAVVGCSVNDPAFASVSARSLPGALQWPGIQETRTDLAFRRRSSAADWIVLVATSMVQEFFSASTNDLQSHNTRAVDQRVASSSHANACCIADFSAWKALLQLLLLSCRISITIDMSLCIYLSWQTRVLFSVLDCVIVPGGSDISHW